MKKYVALVVAVLLLVCAGASFAADSTAGHGGSQEPGGETPTQTGSTGSEAAGATIEQVVETKPEVTVTVVSVTVATVATAADVKTEVVQAVVNAITSAVNNILAALGITSTGGSAPVVQTADNIEVNESEAYASEEEAMEQSAARLANNGISGQTAVAALPRGMEVKASGLQPVSLPAFAKEMYHKIPQMNMFPRGKFGAGEFVAAAEGDAEAVFLDSTGAQRDVIPGEDEANGAEPGKLTAVVYMEAGEVYDPVISVPTEEIANDPSITTSQVSVAEEVITYDTFMATSTFSTNVSSALLKGTNYTIIPAGAVSTTGWEYTDSEKSSMEADPSFDVYTVVALPAITAPEEPTWYIAAVSFDRGTKTASDLYTGAALEFFPDGAAGEPDTTAKILKESNGSLVDLTAAEVFGASSRYTQGYVAFQLSSAASKPVVATDIKKAESGEKPGDETPGGTDTTISDPGSSGGGCDAGFTALALAVLGGFIAARKK